jgi:prepilin-type N-terminal cleavage/methylation domain-containing protein
MRRCKCKNSGFTLIELLMTIVVLGIVAVPLSLLISQHVESVIQSEDLTMASQFARLEMEKVNNLAYATIVSTTTSQYKGYDYDVTRAVTFAQGTNTSQESLKKITVSVARSSSSDVLTSLVTYIAKNINYGL